ncbi:hypothetical protein [Methanocella sp. MCL-LM]|uniref:hypothetical protein n=1 Tax=Methanocella sp. MCL-LM TaxID=3412035 RepID=UPI003C740AD4
MDLEAQPHVFSSCLFNFRIEAAHLFEHGFLEDGVGGDDVEPFAVMEPGIEDLVVLVVLGDQIVTKGKSAAADPMIMVWR